MTFKERMAYAREHNKQPRNIDTTTIKPPAMTEFEYCKLIVDQAILKTKKREQYNDK